MATQKKLAPENQVVEYIPPRLVKARQGWYVVYYHLLAGFWTRERKTFNLNRIADKRRRLERAREIIEQLDGSLSVRQGDAPAADYNALSGTPVVEAIDFAVGIVCQSPKYETRKSFRMIRKMLVEFLERKRLTGLTVAQFDGKVARAFLDDAVQRGISNTTFNNYRGFAGIVFNKLVSREYIAVNPFHKIEKLEREEKRRRPFTPEERGLVLAEIYRTDFWLFVLVMLHFMCLIRRTECYRLRFSDVRLADGYIQLSRTKTKNKRQGEVTIPDSLREMLLDERFTRYPGNFLLFGARGMPHASRSAGDSTFKERHRQVLLRLHRQKKLPDIEGLSLYSWKDTGMTEFADFLSPFELRDHARFASIEQILTYYHGKKVIEGVKRAKITLPDPDRNHPK